MGKQRCDATYYGLPVGECSDDRFGVWHGMDTPAIACGKHALPPGAGQAVFHGHRVRIGLAEPLSNEVRA